MRREKVSIEAQGNHSAVARRMRDAVGLRVNTYRAQVDGIPWHAGEESNPSANGFGDRRSAAEPARMPGRCRPGGIIQ